MSKLTVEEQIIAIAEIEVREIEVAAFEDRDPVLLSNCFNPSIRSILLGEYQCES